MHSHVKMCVDRTIGRGQRHQAFDRALSERADNLLVAPVGDENPVRQAVAGPLVARATLFVSKRWAPGRTLAVSFLDGPSELCDRVAKAAREWESSASLRFDFGRHPAAELRVSFQADSGSWSWIGTDALSVEPGRPTINFGWLTATTPQDELRRVVLHEFGHVLGLVHEHQNPAAAGVIPWNVNAVYEYYAQFGWSRSEIDANVLQTYSREHTNFTEFDRSSIMLYPVDDRLTDGSFSVGWNRELSVQDRAFVRTWYPEPADPVELLVGGARLEAGLDAAEVETFTFVNDIDRRHIVDTRGPTDVHLTLLGPDDPAAVLSMDDDRGQGRNARIVRRLRPGRYWVQVRAGAGNGQGPFNVGVRRYR
jgi:hypothetical protein